MDGQPGYNRVQQQDRDTNRNNSNGLNDNGDDYGHSNVSVLDNEQTPLLSHSRGDESSTQMDNEGGHPRPDRNNHVGQIADTGADEETGHQGAYDDWSPSADQEQGDRHQNVQENPSGWMPPPPLPPDRLQHWSKIYSRSVKVVGFILIACLVIIALASWVAQRVLDHAMVLQIQRTDIYNMDQTGFQILIRSTVHLDPVHDGLFGLTGMMQRIFQPTLAIEPAVLSLCAPTLVERGASMAEFEMERQQMQMGQTLQLNVSTHVRVSDTVLMADFFRDTLQRSTVDLTVRGPIRARLGPLWYLRLQLNQLVTLDGLKGVQNATLASMALPGDHPQGGIIMSGVAIINNPSKIVSVQMGAVTFGIYLPSKAHPEVSRYKIAEVQCSELRLVAGRSNEIALSGRLLHLDDWIMSTVRGQKRNSSSEKQMLLGQLLSRFIQGDNSTIQVQALANDPKMPPWLSMAFSSVILDMVFPGSPNKEFIRSLDMNQLQFGFSDSCESALLSGRLSSVLQLPPNVTFPIKLREMKPMASLRSPGGHNMSTLAIIDFLPTQSWQVGTTLEVDVTMRDAPMVVAPGQHAEFYRFLNTSFTSDWIDLGIVGDALAVVESGLGTFEIGPIPFDVITRQRGLSGLTSVPPVLEKLDVVDSTEHSLTVKATLMLWNPSNITAILGDLSFLWSYKGYLIGMATVSDLHLQAGNNTVECFGMMDPSIDCARKHDPSCDSALARNASREFISKYISGSNSTTIDILGYAGSTKIPLLQPMMSSFSISSQLPVIEEEFLLSATMFLLSSSLVLELKNPLDTVITVLYINGTASYNNERLGRILVDFERDITSPKPILIPANDHQNETSGYVKTPRLPALGGSLEVDVVCHIKAKVGGMLTWVDFVKDGVPANVRKGF
ncbi:hypothetical protein BG011_008052 [Mortierella polycephala]|uniref:Tag1-like fifth Ig-like domain-containing protein n=1 Tax=Mortierella polycephala TaxID=41804 RepID=A0A9P6TXV2_9FUNG|nr:hypothetical protein BG011_008052 [Mortierella polycephala]